MSIEVKAVTVNSTDNIHLLKGKMYVPDGEIKGLFHIVHGMNEHIERYDFVMTRLAEVGYVCFGYDNLGHGKTAQNEEELGYFAPKDGCRYLVQDVAAFENYVKKLYPDKPLFLFGHSMGSFIARLAMAEYGTMYRKAVICGTSGKNPAARFGLVLVGLIKKIKGERYISSFCLNLMYGTYNRRFEKTSSCSWLTKDKEIVEKYEKDRFCSFRFTVSGLYDLLKMLLLCNRRDWYRSLRKDLPVLLISGTDDPVGSYGKSVRQVYRDLSAVGVPCEMELYENCRHEILNDSCRDEVIKRILGFIS